MQFNGEGIQHIALICDNLLEVVDKLGMAGVPLATAQRRVLRNAGHPPARPRPACAGAAVARHLAGRHHRRRHAPPAAADLLHAHAGPGVLEFIQREGDYRDGFGEGNFRKALFESLERDQIRRGVLAADKA